jgi:hypothetical protein
MVLVLVPHINEIKIEFQVYYSKINYSITFSLGNIFFTSKF